MLRKLRGGFLEFVNGPKQYPVFAAITSGLYPLLSTYDSNFPLVNSWAQFGYHVLMFILFPVLLFLAVVRILKNTNRFSKYHKYVLPALNFCMFAALMVLITVGTKKKMMVVAIFLAACLALLIYRHLKKIMVLQLIMAVMVLFTLIPLLIRYQNYSSAWMVLPDDILKADFIRKPNVYIIQPDAYANFSELSKDPYNYNNSEFETYLAHKKFTFYDSFRSNYSNTVTSNCSMFSMKHHYYNNPRPKGITPVRYRSVIAGNNPVHSIFKKNGYRTFLLLEKSYLILNRPEIKYDYCNLDYSEIPMFSQGFDSSKDILSELDIALDNNSPKPSFYFIEKMKPGHIPVKKSASSGKDYEREVYIDELEIANAWLREITDLITKKDPNGLIIIVADHGGYVGWNATEERVKKTNNKVLLNSIFTSMLAIKWPRNKAPSFDSKLKSNVNLFRILISYLSENPAYLEHLENNGSYITIYEGAPFGVYQVLNDKGDVVFKRKF